MASGMRGRPVAPWRVIRSSGKEGWEGSGRGGGKVGSGPSSHHGLAAATLNLCVLPTSAREDLTASLVHLFREEYRALLHDSCFITPRDRGGRVGGKKALLLS